jgi:tetratricopeptide (TPR) repeat protein
MAISNWGISLSRIASLKKDKSIFVQGIEKLKVSLEKSDYNYAPAYINWGAILIALSEIDEKNTKVNTAESIEKFEKGIKLEPNNLSFIDRLSGALLNYSIFFEGKEKKKILEKAKEKSELASQDGNHFYNLACAYCLLDKKEKALMNLEKSLQINQIDVKHVKLDNDWQSLKEDKEFIEILKKYK